MTIRPARKRQLSALATALCLLALAASACSAEDAADEPKRGTLVAQLSDGGVSVEPPKKLPDSWRVTFGSLLICGPDEATITAVKPHYKVGAPVDVRFLLRTVPGVDEREGRRQIVWSPAGSQRRGVDELVRRGDMRFATLDDAVGARVNQPCWANADKPFTEIVTAMTVDRGGVWIDGLEVAYETTDGSFTMPVSWSYVACGALITDPEVC